MVMVSLSQKCKPSVKLLVGGLVWSLEMIILIGCATHSGPLATLPMTSPIASTLNLEGIKLYNSGKWAAAKAQFEQAVEADPQMAVAHFNLGLTLHKLEHHEEATREFKMAGALDPGNKQIVDTSVYRNHLGLSSTFERHISGGYRY